MIWLLSFVGMFLGVAFSCLAIVLGPYLAVVENSKIWTTGKLEDKVGWVLAGLTTSVLGYFAFKWLIAFGGNWIATIFGILFAAYTIIDAVVDKRLTIPRLADFKR